MSGKSHCQRLLFLFTYCVIVVSTVAAQQSGKKYPTFLRKSEIPQFEYYLPAPPDHCSSSFAADSLAYEMGKSIRETERGYQAVADADVSPSALVRRMAESSGLDLSSLPLTSLTSLIELTINDAYQGISDAKRHYQRKRPFVYFGEPTSIPHEEESHRRTFSYPSAHSAMAWAAALVMAELFPSCQNEILKAGYDYGQSRVITGYHYQSDVDAARLAALAVVARLHADKAFRQSMKRVKRDIRHHSKAKRHDRKH